MLYGLFTVAVPFFGTLKLRGRIIQGIQIPTRGLSLDDPIDPYLQPVGRKP